MKPLIRLFSFSQCISIDFLRSVFSYSFSLYAFVSCYGQEVNGTFFALPTMQILLILRISNKIAPKKTAQKFSLHIDDAFTSVKRMTLRMVSVAVVVFGINAINSFRLTRDQISLSIRTKYNANAPWKILLLL